MLVSVQPISVVALLGVVNLEHDGPPLALLLFPHVPHLLVHGVSSLTLQVKMTEFQSTEEILPHIIH